MGGARDAEKWGFIPQRDLITRSSQLGQAREIEREQRNKSIRARSIQKREGLSGSGKLGGA